MLEIVVVDNDMNPNISKIDNLTLHFAQKEILHLGLKKLAKLFYFVDFTNFELKGNSVTGLDYLKWPYGPVPKDYYNWLKKLENRGSIRVEKQKKDFIPAKIVALKEPDYTVFTEDELKIIWQITDRFKNETAATIESVAKAEAPYKMVKSQELIPYHLAYYRNSFDEMALDENSDK